MYVVIKEMARGSKDNLRFDFFVPAPCSDKNKKQGGVPDTYVPFGLGHGRRVLVS